MTESQCPKCWAAGVRMTYQAPGGTGYGHRTRFACKREDEHMAYTCTVCGYGWCADLPPKPMEKRTK